MTKLEGKEVAIIGVVLLILAGAIIAIGAIPASAFNGGVTTYDCSLQITGTYNDALLVHTVDPFSVNFGSCHTEAALDLVPGLPVPFNLAGFNLKFGISVTDTMGAEHCVGCTITAGIPPLQTSYGFTTSTVIKGLPAGVYMLTITSPYTLPSGGLTYSTQVTVSSS